MQTLQALVTAARRPRRRLAPGRPGAHDAADAGGRLRWPRRRPPIGVRRPVRHVPGAHPQLRRPVGGRPGGRRRPDPGRVPEGLPGPAPPAARPRAGLALPHRHQRLPGRAAPPRPPAVDVARGMPARRRRRGGQRKRDGEQAPATPLAALWRSGRPRCPGADVRPQPLGLTRAPDPDADPERCALRAEQAGEVRAVLERLPPRHRAVLALREWHGLAYAEIGAALGLSRKQTKHRLFRARAAFRREWSRTRGPWPERPAAAPAAATA